MLQTKVESSPEIKTELMCQCARCRDSFTVGATVSGRKILYLEPHRKITRHPVIHHTCGGGISFFQFPSF